MSLFLNSEACSSMKWTAGWNGVWIAEVDLMPSTVETDTLPSGRVAITSASGIALSGTVDANYSAAVAGLRRARVIGGSAGWSEGVRAQHYHREGGTLLFREVLSTTAAEVGEVAVLLEPITIGDDYVRHDGLASQIFADAKVDWWVDALGITRVGTRLELPPPADLQITDWHPDTSTMSFACSVLVEPGTFLVDQRFGRRVVHKVEALVSEGAVTGTLYVAESAPEKGSVHPLVDGIKQVANDAVKYARLYDYVVDGLDPVDANKVHLVAMTKTMPNLVPVNVWAGASGYRAKLRPGTRVLVGFREDNTPFVAFYEPPNDGGWRPLELEIDALEKLTMGAVATKVVLGPEEGALPVARAPAIEAFADALGTALSVAAGAIGTAGGPLAPLATIVETLGKSVESATEAMKEAIRSAKVVSS